MIRTLLATLLIGLGASSVIYSAADNAAYGHQTGRFDNVSYETSPGFQKEQAFLNEALATLVSISGSQQNPFQLAPGETIESMLNGKHFRY